MIFHEKQEHRVNTSFISLHVTYQTQTSTVIRSASATFYMPAPLVQMQFFQNHREQRQHRQCVLRVVTELAYSPYTCANYHTQVGMTQCVHSQRLKGKTLTTSSELTDEWTSG